MDFGVVFPTTQIGTDPAVIRDFAQTAEGLGYRRLLVYDHVLGAVHADRDPPLPRTRSCSSPPSPPARRRSSSGPPCSSCRSGRPPWWRSRPPRWTCSPP